MFDGKHIGGIEENFPRRIGGGTLQRGGVALWRERANAAPRYGAYVGAPPDGRACLLLFGVGDCREQVEVTGVAQRV